MQASPSQSHAPLRIALRVDRRADCVRPGLHRGSDGVVPDPEELGAVEAEGGAALAMSKEAGVLLSQGRQTPASAVER